MSEERRFDLELQERLADFDVSVLPEEEQVLTSPWQHLAGRLLWGLGLTTITLNFLYLDLILPAIGMILLVQAFRPLRRENGWLRLCHILAWILCAVRLVSFALQGTLLPETEWFAALQLPAGLAVAAVWLVFYVALWRGLLAVGRRAGQEHPTAPGVVMLMVWYGALMALALTGVEQVGWLAFALIVVIYVLVFRSLYKTLQFFEENGYVLQPLQHRVSDRALTALWLAAVAAAIALALTFGTRYPMDWQERPADEQAGYEEIAENLRTLGLPEEIVADLAPEDLAWLQGAQKVIVDDIYRPWETEDDGVLKQVSAAVQLDGERDEWVMIHHFVWQELPRHRSTEALQIWPTYGPNYRHTEDLDRSLRGRLLCEQDGVTVTAPYANVQELTVQDLFGTSQETFYVFSLPRKGEAVRGYLIYGFLRTEGWLISSNANYVHANRLTLPYVTAQGRLGRWMTGQRDYDHIYHQMLLPTNEQ